MWYSKTMRNGGGGKSRINNAYLCANFFTKQEMYAQRHTEARSRNHCCSGKAKVLHVSVHGRWREFARV
jgi:hypothetical protein